MKLGDLIEVAPKAYNINLAFRQDECGEMKAIFYRDHDILMICREFKRDKDNHMFALLTKFGLMYASKNYILCYTQRLNETW